MNNHQTSAFPWDVIARLYERLLQQVPGSQEAEITEHAIDLVLNRQEKPSDPEYLFYDVLKNARYSKRRTYQRHYKFFQQFNTLVKNNFYHQTPESYYVSKEIYSTIIQRINSTNRSVNRTRKRIRKIACDCFALYGLDC